MTVLLLAATGVVLLLAGALLGRCTAGWHPRRAPSRFPRPDRVRAPVRSLPPGLPDGHQPPIGLGPICPSERSLSAESTRGLRDLQLFLFDPA